MDRGEPDREKRVAELESLLREATGFVNRRTRANLSQFGLSLPRLFVLVLVEKGGSVSQKAVQEQMGLAPSTVSAFVDQLVGEGLLERERNAADRRNVLLRLTGKGADLLAAILSLRRRILSEALADLPDQDLDRINGYLRAMVKGMDQSDHAGA